MIEEERVAHHQTMPSIIGSIFFLFQSLAHWCRESSTASNE
jgi:hypothetical protein